MTSKEKIKDILDWVQNTVEVNWGIMLGLRQDLEELVVIAQTEGVKEAKNALDDVWNNGIKVI